MTYESFLCLACCPKELLIPSIGWEVAFTRDRVAVSATFAMVGVKNDPPSNSNTNRARRPRDKVIKRS